MGEMVFGQDRMQTNAPWKTSGKRNDFSVSVSRKKGPRLKENGCYLVTRLVSLGDMGSELSFGNKQGLESGDFERLLNYFL